MIRFNHRNALNTMIDHELQHPRKPSCLVNVDEFWRHSDNYDTSQLKAAAIRECFVALLKSVLIYDERLQ
jgi:hypothetical protein